MSLVLTFPDKRFKLQLEHPMSVADFYNYSHANPELVMELETDGSITVMSPVTFRSGKIENLFSAYLTIWSIETGLGEVFSSSTGFTLPDGSVRAPDTAWVSDEKIAQLSEEDQQSFAPLVPEFIVEVRSKTDRLPDLQTKMQDTWIGNGVHLAWLIDLANEQVFIYRADQSVEIVNGFASLLSGEQVLPGFSFDLKHIK
ncbi:Uma2 family endonuclease [Lewinella cohaerens]|uniref:Uma2 family endonuclease n=1 Tax=Lewinella cohaerens TaxID=70995 RepID=UPI000373FCE0|nr:Uma2 family endonuclease [Lewinella cohaerens]